MCVCVYTHKKAITMLRISHSYHSESKTMSILVPIFPDLFNHNAIVIYMLFCKFKKEKIAILNFCFQYISMFSNSGVSLQI